MNPQAESIPDILDIAPPQPVGDPFYWIAVAAAAIAALALIIWAIVFVIRALRRRAQRPPQSVAPHIAAQSALDDAEASMDRLSPNELTVRVSNILKRYIYDRYEDRVLFETVEEFSHRDSLEKKMPVSKRQAMEEFLTRCEHIKFSRFPEARDQCNPLLEIARNIVRETTSNTTRRAST